MVIPVLIITIVVLGITIIILLAFLYNDVKYWYRVRKIRRKQNEKVAGASSIAEFKRDLVRSSLKMIKKGKKIEYPTLFADTFISRSRLHYKQQDPVNILSWQYSESGWLLYALMEANCDIQTLKTIFDRHIINEKIVYVDQSECGIIALSLYKKTHEVRYKKYADSLWQFLVDCETEYGMPYRKENSYQILVDTIGMAIPFIIEYAEMFHKPALLAYRSVEKFIKFGIDDETGLPVFSFLTTSPHLKCGMSNWGRGCAWFVIGISYINETSISQFGKKRIQKLDQTLMSIWNRDKSFGHYIGEAGRDLSAELPILYYLYKKKLITLSDVDILKYSVMCHDGVMYNSSSSNTGIIKYGTCLGPNVLSQAYMLRLICEYEIQQRI